MVKADVFNSKRYRSNVILKRKLKLILKKHEVVTIIFAPCLMHLMYWFHLDCPQPCDLACNP